MEVSMLGQILVMLYSVILGGVLGFIYDFFRIFRVLCGINYKNKFSEKIKSINLPKIKNPMSQKKNTISKDILIIITDILYFLTITPIVVVFTYHFNNGKIRWFIFFGIVVGFLVYYFTVGKLIILVSEYIAFAIKVVFSYLIYFLLRPFFKIFIILKIKIDIHKNKLKEKRKNKIQEMEKNKRKQNYIMYFGKPEQ